MRCSLLVYMLLIVSKLNAQYRYEAFAVNDKYGVVNTSDLSEFVEPKYNGCHCYYADVFSLRTEQFTDFYDKSTGNRIRFNQWRPESIKVKNEVFFCYSNEESSYLIPHYFKNKIILPKPYKEFKYRNGFLIVKQGLYFDIYKWLSFDNIIVSHIPATNYLYRELKDKKSGKYLSYHIFYGLNDTYFYDESFRLKETYGNVKEYFEIEKLLTEKFEILNGKFQTDNTEAIVHSPITTKNSKEFTVENEDGKTYIFVSDFEYDWHLYNGKLKLYNYERKEYYYFTIDFENKKFLLPLFYQKKIGLRFME